MMMARRAVVVAVLGLELLGLGAGFMLPPSTPQHASIRPASTSGEPLTVMKAGSFKLSSLATLQGLQSAASLVWDELRHGTEEGKEEVDRLRDWITKKVGVQPEDIMHPMFGEIIKDLGYKRIYCISCEKLVSIPVWEKQRIFRSERAALIAADIKAKLEAGQPLTLPGVITVYEMGDKMGLLDGQHRVGALKLLSEQEVLSPEAHLILVEVFPVESEQDVKRLFTEINTAQPVNIIDLPDMANAAEKEMIDRAAEMLRLEFPKMFSPSQNCRIPNVNIDNLRDELFKANVVGRFSMATAEQVVEWIKVRNGVLAKRPAQDWMAAYKGRSPDAVTKALDKARTHGLFLGLERSWVDIDVPDH